MHLTGTQKKWQQLLVLMGSCWQPPGKALGYAGVSDWDSGGTMDISVCSSAHSKQQARCLPSGSPKSCHYVTPVDRGAWRSAFHGNVVKRAGLPLATKQQTRPNLPEGSVQLRGKIEGMLSWLRLSFHSPLWWHPTPVLLPGKSHGWRSLVGCSPWGC